MTDLVQGRCYAIFHRGTDISPIVLAVLMLESWQRPVIASAAPLETTCNCMPLPPPRPPTAPPPPLGETLHRPCNLKSPVSDSVWGKGAWLFLGSALGSGCHESKDVAITTTIVGGGSYLLQKIHQSKTSVGYLMSKNYNKILRRKLHFAMVTTSKTIITGEGLEGILSWVHTK